MRELLLKSGCVVDRTGQGEPPATVTIPLELVDQLALGKDKALLRGKSLTGSLMAQPFVRPRLALRCQSANHKQRARVVVAYLAVC